MEPASQLARRTAAFAAEHHLFEGVERLRVGFSGGIDSTALLLLLRELGHPLVAHHIHHGLRGENADADADWCQEFCAARNIPFQLHRLSVPDRQEPGESVETAARRCRLELWERVCATGEAVALGHHADDAIEDLFLRLARGANASGLVGLRPRRTIRGVTILRPLLPLHREELAAYLHDQGIRDWREDHTNANPIHRRNAIRLRLLPAFRDIFDGAAGLHRALAALRDDADYLEAQARQALHPAMSRSDWQKLPPALLPRVLRLWVGEQTDSELPPTHPDIARLRDALARSAPHPVEIPLISGPVAILDQDGLRLKACLPALPERHWHWQDDPVLPLPEIQAQLVASHDSTHPGETFARDALPPVLTVRSRLPGDRLVPFGSRTPKKLQDLLVDARLPAEQRDALPILVAEGTIIWVPGLRRAEFGRTSPGQETVHIALRPLPSR